jgi:bifunctional non-homologous end joining protein LigD
MADDRVMLASARKEDPVALIRRLTGRGYSFEMKLDGVRAVLHQSLHPELTNRTGRKITHRYPDVIAAWRKNRELAGRDVVLDGELVVLTYQGEPVPRGGVPHFPSIHKRDAQESPADVARTAAALPATFIPFDILRLDGQDMRSLPYRARRSLLLDVVGIEAAVYGQGDGLELWDTVTHQRLEGLIAKRDASTYTVGRSTSWIKIKATRRALVLAAGYKPGTGARGGLGSITMAVWSPEDGRLVEVGHVGTGFTAIQLRSLQRRLDEFHASGGAGEALVLEVEFLEVSDSGKLRHPVFVQVVPDVAPDAVTLDALLA